MTIKFTVGQIHLGKYSWGTAGAHLGRTWGTLGAHLGHSRGKNDLKHSLTKLNTLGAHLGHAWGTKLLWAHSGHTWGKNYLK